MAPPSFVAAYVGPTPSASPGSTAVTAAVNDTLVCYAGTGDSTLTLNAPSGGSGLTWTLRQSVVGNANTSNCYLWTSPVTVALSSASLSVTKSAGSTSFYWGYVFMRFSGVAGFGGSSSTFITGTGAPTLNITTQQAHSVIVVGDTDFVPASGTPVWRTNAGAFTQEQNQYVASNLGLYSGFHANDGAIGTYAVGMTSPSGQTYSIVALELTGSSSTPQSTLIPQAVQRAGYY